MNIIKRTIGFSPRSSSLYAAIKEETLALLACEYLFIADMPAVVSATCLRQPINESPVSSSIIDSQLIIVSSAQTITDLLRLVHRFTTGYMSHNCPVTTYYAQSDRFSKHVQLPKAGRPINLPTLSGTPRSEFVIQ